MSDISELAYHLNQQAEALCRRYLSHGKQVGQYWKVGNIDNEPGQSLYVHLAGFCRGKWVDAATGEHGDMFDLLKHYHGADSLHEARKQLGVPEVLFDPLVQKTDDNFKRLLSASQAISGTAASLYLAGRGIDGLDLPSLRFHPRVWYREAGQHHQAPALLAKVTDIHGQLVGIHRSWLDPFTNSLASIPHPRKSRGRIKGHAVRFGMPALTLVVGEGIETVLSLKMARPDLSIAAALSANNLAAFIIPLPVKLLVIAADRDEAGLNAAHKLHQRCRKTGILAIIHEPVLADFNDDLRQFGVASLQERLEAALAWV